MRSKANIRITVAVALLAVFLTASRFFGQTAVPFITGTNGPPTVESVEIAGPRGEILAVRGIEGPEPEPSPTPTPTTSPTTKNTIVGIYQSYVTATDFQVHSMYPPFHRPTRASDVHIDLWTSDGKHWTAVWQEAKQ